MSQGFLRSTRATSFIDLNKGLYESKHSDSIQYQSNTYIDSWLLLGISASPKHFCHRWLCSVNSFALRGENYPIPCSFPGPQLPVLGECGSALGILGFFISLSACRQCFWHTSSKGSSYYIVYVSSVLYIILKIKLWQPWSDFLLVMSSISHGEAFVNGCRKSMKNVWNSVKTTDVAWGVCNVKVSFCFGQGTCHTSREGLSLVMFTWYLPWILNKGTPLTGSYAQDSS